jgi:hypothetical protein
MQQHLPVLLCAALLSACGSSTGSTRPSFLPPAPPPPTAALQPCLPTPQARQPNGSASAADDDATIRQGRLDLRACDDKRRLLLDAWPR